MQFLNGVRVLDLTRLLPGSYTTTTLADFGAEIIKVEEPQIGDPIRHRSPKVEGLSYAHLVRNRNKRSIGIDLKNEEGRKAFYDLIETADVVIESFRPGVTERLGVDFESVREYNDSIIYCSLTGYGQAGPYAEQTGHDINFIGVGGLLGLTGNLEGEPVPPGFPVADFAGGLYAAFAITTALAGRENSKEAVYFDVAMTDVITSFAVVYADEYFGSGNPQKRGETRLSGGHPAYGVFECADGNYITISALEKEFWDILCEAIGRPKLQGDYEQVTADINGPVADKCREAFADAFSMRDSEEWLQIFNQMDFPVSPVNEYQDLFDDPHLKERGLFDELEISKGEGTTTIEQFRQPVVTSGTTKQQLERAPSLGEDTIEVLIDIGYSDQQIVQLVANGSIAIDLDF